MIVAILLSYLSQVNQRRHFRDIYLGVAAAFVLIFVGGIAAYFLIQHYDGSNVQTYFETATYVVAAAVLTYMTFWMHAHARTMAKELRERSDVVLSKGSRIGMGIMAFQAVGREGLETMVFTLAIIFASSRQAATPVHGNLLWLGAILGLALALGIAFAIYRLGAKLNLKRFFQVLGIVLMIFAAGLLSDAVQNLQQLGWLPFGNHAMWDSSGMIAESSNLGNVMHSLVGYAERPTVLQGFVWVVYVTVSIATFVGIGRLHRSRGRHHGPRTTSPDPRAH